MLNACEKALFGSAESAAAAVAYAASQITLLTALGDVATANKGAGSELHGAAPRGRARPLRPDGLCADGARPLHAVGMRGVPLADRQHQIAANMDERVYESLVARYAPSWNAPAAGCRRACVAALPPSMPTGKPTNAEFPTSASTPPVNIMTPEPPLAAPRRSRAPAAAPLRQPAPRPAAGRRRDHSRRRPRPRSRRRAEASRRAPVQLAPAAAAPAADSNE